MPLDSANTDYAPRVDFDAPSLVIPRTTENVLQPVHEGAVDRPVNATDWTLGVVLLICAMLTWIRVFHLKRVKELFQAFLYKQHVYALLRSNDSLVTRASLALNTTFVLVMSLFLCQLTGHYDVLSYSGHVNLFGLICLALVVIYGLKALVLKLAGLVFNETEKFAEYIFNVFLLNKILALVLVPIVILVTYLSFGQAVLLKIGLSLVLVFYVYRLFRGYTIARVNAKLSLFYIILYLCALEILPLAIITRFISGEL